MASVHITVGVVQARALTGSTMPVIDSVPLAAKTVTSSGASAQASGISAAPGQIWSVTAVGGAVHIAFGSNPTAGADAGFLVADGSTRDFAAVGAGEKIAIKDAA